MNLKETFYLNRLRCQVAMQQALRSWNPPVYAKGIQGTQCPFCQSQRITTAGYDFEKRRYRCQDCKRRFVERPLFICSCQVPGKLSKCQDCPHFQPFIAQVEQIVEKLRNLSQEELEGML